MNYTHVTSQKQLEDLANCASQWGVIGVDTETTGLDALTDKVLLIQLGTDEKQFIIDVFKFPNPEQQLKVVWDIFYDKDTVKVLHNAKFDYKFLKTNFNIKDIANIADTWVAENLLNKGRRFKEFDLASVTERYVDFTMDKSVRKSFINLKPGTEFTQEQMVYAALDVAYLPEILSQQSSKIRSYGMTDLSKMEYETTKVTGDMELNGMFLNRGKWFDLEIAAREKLTEASKKLDKFFVKYSATKSGQMQLDLCGENFINYNSPLQLREALSYVLGFQLVSTAEPELKKLNHPVITALLDYREAFKRMTTYGSAFIRENVNPLTGRIHSSFNQMRADSGRFSSSDPNLQNIPADKEYRAAFTVQFPNRRMGIADYSGCELRLLAELSGEEAWLDALETGKDLHTVVCSIIQDIPYESMVDDHHVVLPKYKELRRLIKILNFALMYGAGPRKLADSMGVPLEKSKETMGTFFGKFKKIRACLNDLVTNAEERDYALSPLDGRRRYLTDFDWEIPKEAAHAANIAKNMPFQGGNASITKKAMVNMRNNFIKNNLDSKAKLICCIHDEILTEHEDSISDDDMKNTMEKEMLDAAYHYVKKAKMAVDVKISDHWEK